MGHAKKYGLVALLSLLIVSLIIYLSIDNNENQIRIGVIDSGCSSNQKNHVAKYVSFTNTSYGYSSDESTAYDQLGHGTAVCQLIINNLEIDQFAIYSAKIAHVDGTLTFEALFAAMEYLVEEVGVDIINLSLGSPPTFVSELASAFKEYSKSTVIVAAAGNTGSNSYITDGRGDWPAVLPWTIGVSAFDTEVDQPAVFSASGHTYFGAYIAEFSANGYYLGYRGTSMAAPVISAKVANLIYQLESMDISYDANDITALLVKSTGSWVIDQFHPTLGWGQPLQDYELASLLNPTFVVHGGTFRDSHTHFAGENWKIRFKTSRYALESSAEIFSKKGNASDFLSSIEIQEFWWGGYLDLAFQAPLNLSEGNYQLIMEQPYGNTISYSFNYENQSKGKILLDHRFGVNGYGHPYGSFSQLEYVLRQQGYQVRHALGFDNSSYFLGFDTSADLTNFDFVFAPNMYGVAHYPPTSFSQIIPDELITQYLSYLDKGGNFVGFFGSASNTDIETANNFVNLLGANLTGNEIGNSIVTISNFTDPDIFDDVAKIDFDGSEIQAIGNQSRNIAYYRKSVSGPFGPDISFLPVAMTSHYGNGSIILFGSTYPLTNKNLVQLYGINFDRVASNILGL